MRGALYHFLLPGGTAVVRDAVPRLTWGYARAGTGWYGRAYRIGVTKWYMTLYHKVSDTLEGVLIRGIPDFSPESHGVAELPIGELVDAVLVEDLPRGNSPGARFNL